MTRYKNNMLLNPKDKFSSHALWLLADGSITLSTDRAELTSVMFQTCVLCMSEEMTSPNKKRGGEKSKPRRDLFSARLTTKAASNAVNDERALREGERERLGEDKYGSEQFASYFGDLNIHGILDLSGAEAGERVILNVFSLLFTQKVASISTAQQCIINPTGR